MLDKEQLEKLVIKEIVQDYCTHCCLQKFKVYLSKVEVKEKMNYTFFCTQCYNNNTYIVL